MKKLAIVCISYMLFGASITLYCVEAALKLNIFWMKAQYPFCMGLFMLIVFTQLEPLKKKIEQP